MQIRRRISRPSITRSRPASNMGVTPVKQNIKLPTTFVKAGVTTQRVGKSLPRTFVKAGVTKTRRAFKYR